MSVIVAESRDLEHRWVDSTAGLEQLVGAALAAGEYAVDTEFHRERTYYPQLALIQLRVDDDIALIDPLAVDVGKLAELFEGDGLAIMHAASQDLEVLELACGAVPSRLFDTQVAAGFAGMSSPSLASLVDRIVGVRLPKGDRLTDWLQRPLGTPQQDYAAADVLHLHHLHRHLCEELEARGRLEWAIDECEQLRARDRSRSNPEEAWIRIKEARHLRGSARCVAKELAAWRETTAQRTDQPVRFVLGDLGLVGIAQKQPRTVDALKQIRGLDGRSLRNGGASEILDVVAAGLALPPDSVKRPEGSGQNNLERELRPAVSLVSAWVSQVARDESLDPALLATRADIVEFLRDGGESRISTGWRHELIGEPIRALVGGRAALSFDGRGGLVLEARNQGGT